MAIGGEARWPQSMRNFQDKPSLVKCNWPSPPLGTVTMAYRSRTMVGQVANPNVFEPYRPTGFLARESKKFASAYRPRQCGVDDRARLPGGNAHRHNRHGRLMRLEMLRPPVPVHRSPTTHSRDLLGLRHILRPIPPPRSTAPIR